MSAGADVIVKIDGDGQMDPSLVPRFVAPILRGDADYAKGNRFFDLRHIRRMPPLRRIGNLGLSFMAKASTGYWDVFDPTNGYTAIHARVASMLPYERISRRYFFETDLLFRLNTLRAAVIDVEYGHLFVVQQRAHAGVGHDVVQVADGDPVIGLNITVHNFLLKLP